MTYVLTLLLMVASTFANAQENAFDKLFEKGKASYKSDNYVNAKKLLDSAVTLKPGNVEAHYFLAYTYSRLNTKDARFMIKADQDLTLKASRHLEKVIEISPKYKGEMLILDPYSKLTAEWGTLAMRYLYEDDTDSAEWAFKTGKKRGGFSKFNLAFQKAVLEDCAKNAVLFTYGDNNFFPLKYLQVAKGFRTDVTVIEVNMLNTRWYPKYLEEDGKVDFGISRMPLDSVKYKKASELMLDINDPKWKLEAPYKDEYLLRNHLLIYYFLINNRFKRGVYFTHGMPEKIMLGLDEHTKNLLTARKVVLQGPKELNSRAFYKKAKKMLKLVELVNKNSTLQLLVIHRFRQMIYNRVKQYMNEEKDNKAEKLVELSEQYADPKNYPFRNNQLKELVKSVKEELADK